MTVHDLKCKLIDVPDHAEVVVEVIEVKRNGDEYSWFMGPRELRYDKELGKVIFE